MHFFLTKDKPLVYGGIAAVSLMILTGLTLAGTALVLTVMTPVFVVLSPILVSAVITSSFLATGFLASGSLGASAIALLVWLYKKEDYSRSNMHARVRSKGVKSGKLSRGDKLPEEARPPERDKTTDEIKSTGRDKAEEYYKPSENDRLLERDKMAEEIKPTARDKEEEYKMSEKDKLSEGDHNPADEAKSLGGSKHAEEGLSIPEISKVLLAEKNPIGSKRCGPGTSSKRSYNLGFAMDPAKVRSIFLKEYQKVPRVGALAYKYFTSRDKKYIYHLHI